jgi:hypothetical protein
MKWEYFIGTHAVSFKKDEDRFVAYLDELGKQGWEVVQMWDDEYCGIVLAKVLFKRPVQHDDGTLLAEMLVNESLNF